MCFFIAMFAGTLALQGGGNKVNLDGEVSQILRRAGEVAETLPVDVLSPRYRILLEIACLQAAVGDEEGATRTAEEVVKSSNEPAVFHPQARNKLKRAMLQTVAAVKMKRGDLKAAEDLRELARQGASDVPVDNRGSAVRYFAELAKSLAKLGDFEGAVAFAKQAQSAAEMLPISATNERPRRPRPIAFLDVARAFDLAREHVTADDLRKRAIADVKAIIDPEQREEQLGRLIYERYELGDRAGALAWLDASPEVLHLKPNNWIMNFAIRCAEGDPALALRLVDRVTDQSNRVEAIADVAGYLGRLGRWREAATVWTKITPPAGDDTAPSRVYLVALAYAQARAGDRDATLAAARRALVVAEHPGLAPILNRQISAIFDYNRLAAAFWLIGEREQAANLLHKAKAMADAIHDDPPGASGIAYSIVEAEADMGNYDAVIQTLQKEQLPDVHTVRRIVRTGIEVRLKAGDIAAASRLLDALIRAPNGEREATELVEEAANRIAKAGDTALGLRWAEAQTSAERKSLALLSVAQGMVDRSSGPP